MTDISTLKNRMALTHPLTNSPKMGKRAIMKTAIFSELGKVFIYFKYYLIFLTLKKPIGY
jgi:hypothetical protein